MDHGCMRSSVEMSVGSEQARWCSVHHAGVSRHNMQGLVCNMTICPFYSEAGFFIPAIIKLRWSVWGAVCYNRTVCADIVGPDFILYQYLVFCYFLLCFSSVDENFDKFDIPYDVIWLDIEHTDGKR